MPKQSGYDMNIYETRWSKISLFSPGFVFLKACTFAVDPNHLLEPVEIGRSGDSGLRTTPKKCYGYRCRTKMKQLATSSSKIVRNWTFSAPFWGSRLFSWSCALSFWGAPAWMGEFQHKNTPAPLIFLAGAGTFRNETSNQQWWSNTSPPHLCHKYHLFHWRVKVRFYQRVGFRECISN